MTVVGWRTGAGMTDPDGYLHPHPTSADGNPIADVIVVGLGAAGLTCCLELARSGLKVVGLEPSRIGSGASGNNGGFLLAGLALFHHDAVAQLGQPRADAWYQATLDELHQTFADEPHAHRTGSLRVAARPAETEDIDRQRQALLDSGFPVETYDGPHGTGIGIPTDGLFEPLARCHRLADHARDAGATFVGARIREVQPGHLTDVEGWPFDAPTIVIAIDGTLDLLLPQLDLRTARLQMLATEPTTPGTVEQPVYRRYGLDYLRQSADGSIHLGGGRDVEGEHCWTASRDTTPEVQAHLDAELARAGITTPVARRWASHSAWTPDRMPICATVMPGVHVIGGYSGHGNIIGPMLARHVTRCIVDNRTNVSLPY